MLLYEILVVTMAHYHLKFQYSRSLRIHCLRFGLYGFSQPIPRGLKETTLPNIWLPPLLPDNQFTCMVDDVTAASDNMGDFGGAVK